MKNLIDKLSSLLLKDNYFLDENGEVIKEKIKTAALNLDPHLMNLLVTDDNMKEAFFKNVEGMLIFDKVKFSWVITNNDFLPDSFTSFKNKIGLIDEGGSFVKNKEDVTLSFPYKDCVLEFDSTDPDEDRDEVFLNEILAKNQIDVLLSPKAVGNAHIYAHGEDKIATKYSNENLVIKGNNLIGMYSLLPIYGGSIKFMYWDILYNTKDDNVPYNDSFKHSSWLTMMKNRLEIAKKLLKNDGVICLQCDDNEQAYLKVLCDEIFGRDAFINCICVKSSEASGTKMSHVDKKFPKIKDYLLIYKQNENAVVKIKPVKVDNTKNIDEFLEYAKYYSKIIIDTTVPVNEWVIMPIKDYLKKYEPKIDLKDERAVLQFKIKNADRVIYRTNNKSFDKYSFDTETAEIISPSGIRYIWWEGKQMLFLSEYTTSYLCDIWDDISTINLNKEGNVELKAGKKPEKLLERVISCFTSENDIVLDAYFGTGTTGAVALKMNRKFIGLEQLDDHFEKSVKRLKSVVDGDQSGISKELNWNGGGDFIYCELLKSNLSMVDLIKNIKDDKSAVVMLNELLENPCVLNYNANIDLIKKGISEFENLVLDDKKKVLISLLEKNILYVQQSEIDDSNIKISKEDKLFTNSFYSVGK